MIHATINPAIVFIADHALVFGWVFIAIGVAFHILVAWINRPWWTRWWMRGLRRRLRRAP